MLLWLLLFGAWTMSKWSDPFDAYIIVCYVLECLVDIRVNNGTWILVHQIYISLVVFVTLLHFLFILKHHHGRVIHA